MNTVTRNDGPATRDGSSTDDPTTTDGSGDPDADVSARRFEGVPSRLRERLSSRREFLSDSAKAGGVLALSVGSGGVAAATGDGDDDGDDDEVDQSEGISAEPFAPPATFTDDVAAAFAVDYEDGEDETGFVLDASNLVIAEITFEPEGTTGWHTHPGPVVASIVEGEIDLVFEDDCVTRTYAAGEAFVDTGGHAEIATNTSDSEQAVVYAVFFGVPEGEPLTTPVEPRDC